MNTNYYITILYALITLKILVSSKHLKTGLRINEGESFTNEKYLYVGVIGMTDTNPPSTLCTVSLITPKWVLTAAHCIEHPATYDRRTRTVNFGDLAKFPETKYCRHIIKGFRHVMYMHGNDVNNDIGLLLIDKEENLVPGRVSSIDYLSLIGRPVIYLESGENFFKIQGNRNSAEEISYVTKPLRIGEAVVVKCVEDVQDKKFAKRLNTPLVYPINGAFLCLRPKCSNRHQLHKPSDSGGPVLFDGKIVGVAKGPSLYTGILYSAVSPYLDWIELVMSNNTM